MRFTLIKDITQDKAMRPILNGLLLFTLAYLTLDFIVTNTSLGLTNNSIRVTLLGSEEDFIDPMSKALFLEYIHMQIFFIMMLLLTLSAVFARISNKKLFSLLLINTTMSTALLTLLLLILSFYTMPSLIPLYLISFYLWHIGAIIMTLYSLWGLNFETSI